MSVSSPSQCFSTFILWRNTIKILRDALLKKRITGNIYCLILHDTFGFISRHAGLDSLEERCKKFGERFIEGLINGRIDAPVRAILKKPSILCFRLTRGNVGLLGHTNFASYTLLTSTIIVCRPHSINHVVCMHINVSIFLTLLLIATGFSS